MSFENWDRDCWVASEDYIDRLTEWFFSKKLLTSQYNILELGCGRGHLANSLIARGCQVTGVDLRAAESTAKYNHVQQDFISFCEHTQEKRFDTVILKQCFHLLDFQSQTRLLEAIKKCAKETAAILILQISPTTELPLFSKAETSLAKSLISKNTLHKLSLEAGYKVEFDEFYFEVELAADTWHNLLRKKYMSCLFQFTEDELETGIEELGKPGTYKFNDILECAIWKSLNKLD